MYWQYCRTSFTSTSQIHCRIPLLTDTSFSSLISIYIPSFLERLLLRYPKDWFRRSKIYLPKRWISFSWSKSQQGGRTLADVTSWTSDNISASILYTHVWCGAGRRCERPIHLSHLLSLGVLLVLIFHWLGKNSASPPLSHTHTFPKSHRESSSTGILWVEHFSIYRRKGTYERAAKKKD